jgi:hypothetical protein
LGCSEIPIENAVKYIEEDFNFAKKLEALILSKDTNKINELLEKRVEQGNYYYPIFIGNEGRCNYKDFSRSKVIKNMKDDDFKYKKIFLNAALLVT